MYVCMYVCVCVCVCIQADARLVLLGLGYVASTEPRRCSTVHPDKAMIFSNSYSQVLFSP